MNYQQIPMFDEPTPPTHPAPEPQPQTSKVKGLLGRNSGAYAKTIGTILQNAFGNDDKEETTK